MDLPALKLRDIFDEFEEIGPDTFADEKVIAEIARSAAALTNSDVCNVDNEWVVCFDGEPGGGKSTSCRRRRWRKWLGFVRIWVGKNWLHLCSCVGTDDDVFDLVSKGVRK